MYNTSKYALLSVIEIILVYFITIITLQNTSTAYSIILIILYLVIVLSYGIKHRSNTPPYILLHNNISTWTKLLYLVMVVMFIRTQDIPYIVYISIAFSIVELLLLYVCTIYRNRINYFRIQESLPIEKLCLLMLPYLYTYTSSIGQVGSIVFVVIGILFSFVCFYKNRKFSIKKVVTNVAITLSIFIIYQYVQGAPLFIFALYNVNLLNKVL